jgi:hypothetical protein
MIDSINSSPESEIHVGEKVLYIVDRCEDHRKAALAGRLFKRMLEGLLDYADFLTLSGVLDRCSPAEILEFAGEAWDTISLEELPSYLLGTPLVKVWQEQLSVRDQEDWKRSERYVAEGGGVVAEISRLGRELREAFKPSANSQR